MVVVVVVAAVIVVVVVAVAVLLLFGNRQSGWDRYTERMLKTSLAVQSDAARQR